MDWNDKKIWIIKIPHIADIKTALEPIMSKRSGFKFILVIYKEKTTIKLLHFLFPPKENYIFRLFSNFF